MTTIRNTIVCFTVFLFCLYVLVSETCADIHTAGSCSYADVSAAVLAASEGDTVSVPACTETTWNSGLTITKGIILQGGGTGVTNIKGNVGSNTFLVSYNPANPVSNASFILTGFTFNLNSNSLALWLGNNDATHPITKVRIHHNQFLNCVNGGSYSGFTISAGTVQGVFDNNSVTGQILFHNDASSPGGRANWNTLTFSYGTAANFYYEDNTFISATASAPAMVIGCGWGGRYAARYNTWTYNGTGQFPWFDIHGNQPSGVYACMGAEIYGNSWTSSTIPGGNGVKMFHHRGGRAIIFMNKAVSSGGYYSFGTLEEWLDSVSPTDYGSTSSDGQPQHISDSYYWNNRGGSTLIDPGLEADCGAGSSDGYPPCPQGKTNSPSVVQAQREYHYQVAGFNGTTGMGCGTLAARPATCTIGVGYWATNQSCSSVDGANIGANPSTPISGTLYKCTSGNTWTPYYTPYTYPHPLRAGGSGEVSPPQGVRIIN